MQVIQTNLSTPPPAQKTEAIRYFETSIGTSTSFDFAEGESELVSGFNVEYGSGGICFNFFG
jgi:hypothetical protein